MWALVLLLGCGLSKPSPIAEQVIEVPSLAGASAPFLASSRDGALLSWLEPVGEAEPQMVRMRVARWSGEWTEPTTVVERDDLFVNWADTPGVVATDGALFAHWLQRSGEDPYAYDVMVGRSSAGGPWAPMGKLHDDDTTSEHGFVSWVARDGGARAFWLDGRDTVGGGPMALRTTEIGEQVGKSEIVDARTCDCCATAAVRTDAGAVVAYRDRTEAEIRDVQVATKSSGGWRATPVGADGWHMEGCPVNGPAAAVVDDRIAVAWFTGAGEGARVQLAWSGDGGRSFGPPMLVDGEKPAGRVGLARIAGGVVVSWIGRGEDGKPGVQLRTASDERLGAVRTLAETTEARTTGFPRVVAARGGVLAVWTEAAEPSRLRARWLQGLAAP